MKLKDNLQERYKFKEDSDYELEPGQKQFWYTYYELTINDVPVPYEITIDYRFTNNYDEDGSNRVSIRLTPVHGNIPMDSTLFTADYYTMNKSLRRLVDKFIKWVTSQKNLEYPEVRDYLSKVIKIKASYKSKFLESEYGGR